MARTGSDYTLHDAFVASILKTGTRARLPSIEEFMEVYNALMKPPDSTSMVPSDPPDPFDPAEIARCTFLNDLAKIETSWVAPVEAGAAATAHPYLMEYFARSLSFSEEALKYMSANPKMQQQIAFDYVFRDKYTKKLCVHLNAILQPIAVKVFEYHDLDNSGVLSVEESAKFLSQYRMQLPAYVTATSKMIACSTLDSVTKAMLDALPADAFHAKMYSRSWQRKVRALLAKGVSSAMSNVMNEMYIEYEQEKEARDKEAFEVINATRDGKLQRDEVLKALEAGSNENRKLAHALGFDEQRMQARLLPVMKSLQQETLEQVHREWLTSSENKESSCGGEHKEESLQEHAREQEEASASSSSSGTRAFSESTNHYSESSVSFTECTTSAIWPCLQTPTHSREISSSMEMQPFSQWRRSASEEMMRVGHWSVRRDAEGEFYHNSVTGESFDEPPQGLLMLHWLTQTQAQLLQPRCIPQPYVGQHQYPADQQAPYSLQQPQFVTGPPQPYHPQQASLLGSQCRDQFVVQPGQPYRLPQEYGSEQPQYVAMGQQSQCASPLPPDPWMQQKLYQRPERLAMPSQKDEMASASADSSLLAEQERSVGAYATSGMFPTPFDMSAATPCVANCTPPFGTRTLSYVTSPQPAKSIPPPMMRYCPLQDHTVHNWNSQPLCVANTSQLVYLAPYNMTEGAYGTPQNRAQIQVANFKSPENYGTGGPTSTQQVGTPGGVDGKYSRGSSSSDNKKEFSSRSKKKKEFSSRSQNKKDVTGKKEFGECCVCMDRGKSHALVPCGHLCACAECAVHLVKKKLPCPVCRGSIERSVQIYV